MIVIIGLVPEEVGKALASPIQTPGVSCSSPQGPATLVPASVPMRHVPIWCAANSLKPPARNGTRWSRSMYAVHVVADAPARQAGGEGRDLARARGHVQAHLRGDGAMRVGEVDRVVERVPGDRLAVGVDGHAAAAVIANEADEGCAVAHLLHQPLVRLAAGERRGRGRRAGRVLGRLDQESVPVPEVRELVDEAGMRGAPPGALVLEVAAGGGGAGVQTQVLPDRRAADAGAEQQRGGLERAAGDHDAWRAHGHAPAAPGDRVAVERLHPGRAPTLDDDALGEAAHDQLGAVRDCVGQVGLGGRLLGTSLVAEADVARRLGRVARLVDIAIDRLEGPAVRLAPRAASTRACRSGLSSGR